MNTGISPLVFDARRDLHSRDVDTSSVDTLADCLARLAPEQLPEALAHFHNCAGCLPYAGDSDFGALLLEAIADGAEERERAREVLTAALYRARWCAQGATAGGEGMARMIDVERIQAKLESL